MGGPESDFFLFCVNQMKILSPKRQRGMAPARGQGGSEGASSEIVLRRASMFAGDLLNTGGEHSILDYSSGVVLHGR